MFSEKCEVEEVSADYEVVCWKKFIDEGLASEII